MLAVDRVTRNPIHIIASFLIDKSLQKNVAWRKRVIGRLRVKWRLRRGCGDRAWRTNLQLSTGPVANAQGHFSQSIPKTNSHNTRERPPCPSTGRDRPLLGSSPSMFWCHGSKARGPGRPRQRLHGNREAQSFAARRIDEIPRQPIPR